MGENHVAKWLLENTIEQACRFSFRGAKLNRLLLSRGLHYLNNVIANSIKNQFADGMQIELAHDIGTMSFSCLNTQAQCHRHLFRALSFGKELDDFPLAGRENLTFRFVRGTRFAFQEAVQDHLGNFRSKKRLVTLQSLDRRDQVATGVGLE